MATINGKTNHIQHSVLGSVWTGFATTGDVGTPEQLSRYTYHSIQIVSNSATGTVIVEGSDVPNPDLTAGSADWVTLKDVTGSSVTVTSTTGRFDVVDVPRHMRPRATSMAGGTIDVYITSRSLGH